ncbi:hypothetical protein V6N12_051210 [Hibiscus sabdariffa]|uniref:Uncharacterized protein n=1 Tax=Hibiscus sabdariffa TaxID=183260 RepID=A0ABR2GEQ8_9ROSI
MTTDDMTTTSSSPAVCATTSSSPFVFVPTPGHIMTPKNLLLGLSFDHEVLNCVGNPHQHNGNALGSSIPSCQLLILVVVLLPFVSICSRQDESEYIKK